MRELTYKSVEDLLDHMQRGKNARTKELCENRGQSFSPGGLSFSGPLLNDVARTIKGNLSVKWRVGDVEEKIT